MKIGLQLCFARHFQCPGFYRDLYEKFVRFRPERITKKYKTEPWIESKHLKEVLEYDSHDTLALGNDNGELFMTLMSGSRHPHRSITIIQESDLFHPSSEEVQEFITKKELVSAYLYNEDYEYIQTTKSADQVNRRQFSSEMMDSIKNTPWKLGVFDNKEYDVRFNPGSSKLIDHTWIMVTSKMWFGIPFFQLVPSQRLLSFPYAKEIKELHTGQVYVDLYEKIEEPFTPENVFKQWKWKEWLDYDALVERYG